MKAAPAVPLAARRIGDALRAAGAKRARVTWPSPSWRGRHAEFARDVLGVRSLARHQIDILDEYYRQERAEIVVCTGQKLGKTEVEIIAALLDFATEPALNGFVFGPKLEHTNEVFWPRFALMALGAYLPCAKCMKAHRAWCALAEVNPFDETLRPERCKDCSPLIPSELKRPGCPEEGRVSEWLDPLNSEGGLRAPDGRVLRGYASRKIGGKGGISGKVRFYLDESSDIDDATREAIAGNMSGGGKLLAFGNMLHRQGWFYRAFKGEKGRYTLAFQLSSRYSPNCPGRIEWSDGVITENKSGDRPVRGMADRAGIEANLRAWKGTDLITARIDATPPAIIEGQLAASSVVTEAEGRWDASDDGSGVLQFGVDVGRARDPLAIAERRGRKIRSVYAEVLGEEDHARGVEILMGMVREARSRRPHQRRPRIVYDRTGYEGKKFGKELARYIAASKDPRDDVEVIGIEAGDRPRNIKLFFKRRDEIAHHFCNTWLKTGAIPPDGELEAELEATTAKPVPFTWKGSTWEVLRVIDNDELRPILGRSPNKRNACELAALDVDGEDSQEDAAPPPAYTAPEQAGQAPALAPAPAPRRPSPAVEAEEAPRSPFGYQDDLYRSMWGQQ